MRTSATVFRVPIRISACFTRRGKADLKRKDSSSQYFALVETVQNRESLQVSRCNWCERYENACLGSGDLARRHVHTVLYALYTFQIAICSQIDRLGYTGFDKMKAILAIHISTKGLCRDSGCRHRHAPSASQNVDHLSGTLCALLVLGR